LGVQNMKQLDIYGVHNDQGVEDWQTMQCLDVVIGQVQFKDYHFCIFNVWRLQYVNANV
jgi:hypothetical protein